MLAGYELADGQVEHAIAEGIEDELEILAFVLDKFAQARLLHDEAVLVGGCSPHVLARYLLTAFPFVVADVETRHLIVGIVAGFQYGLRQIKIRRVGIYLQLAQEALHFV